MLNFYEIHTICCFLVLCVVAEGDSYLLRSTESPLRKESKVVCTC